MPFTFTTLIAHRLNFPDSIEGHLAPMPGMNESDELQMPDDIFTVSYAGDVERLRTWSPSPPLAGSVT